MDFRHAFHLVRELGMTATGALLSHEALTAIQWTHRVGALATLVTAGALGVAVLGTANFRLYGIVLLGILLIQIGLGTANVLLRLPLVLAAAHNGGAALLLVALVVLNFALFRKPSR
jgi:cytochrome c oxidase assembly protein subunit 15